MSVQGAGSFIQRSRMAKARLDLKRHDDYLTRSTAGADDYCGSAACNRVVARGRAVACGDGSVATGLRVGVVAVGRGGGADILGRRFCSEALAMTRAICSWLALSCSTAFALSRAICCWMVLSCSIPCPAIAISRAIDWSNCVNSGERAAVGASISA